MKSIQCFILLFLILSCITTFSYAQEHDHEHEHEVTNNSTQPVTTPKPTSTSTLTPTPMPDNHEGHNHTEAETGHEGHNHAEGEAGNNHAEGGVAGGHEGHNHAEEEAGGHAGHSHASGFDEETCAVEAHQEYNLNFRIGSLFIILATSAVGIFAPILLHQIKPYEENSLRAWVLTIGKFFGTGVILSTAFVHMLPEAMERFSSPCLSEGWHSYHSFGAIFCMAAAFILQWIELAALSHMDALKAKKQQQQTESTIAENKLEHGENGHIHSAGFLENDQEDLSLRSISTLLLEFGIAVHSIIIGVTLGTSSETTFIVIFIALIFHQFFEGIALGTRINETNVKGSWIKPLIMGLIFICMTPIGIGIGIGVRTTMDVQSLLVSQAILDSISAGILLYNAYVSLMSVEISHSAKFRQYSFGKKSVCLISMYIGAAIMSVLGLWA